MSSSDVGGELRVLPAQGDATGLWPQDENTFDLARKPGWLGLAAAAPTVASEQYWYCPAVVDQGVQTLDALVAAVQVPARRLFFWWD